jgi:hypothetical protein
LKWTLGRVAGYFRKNNVETNLTKKVISMEFVYKAIEIGEDIRTDRWWVSGRSVIKEMWFAHEINKRLENREEKKNNNNSSKI